MQCHLGRDWTITAILAGAALSRGLRGFLCNSEINDELAWALFFVGDVKIVAAPGAVAWETTGRAPGKAEHDKSSADNLSHSRKSHDFEPNVYIQRYIGSNV